MVAVGRIYRNIRFEELGALLEITPAQAEKVAARMIKEGRLSASINQVEGLLDFVEDIDVLQVGPGWVEPVGRGWSRCSRCSHSWEPVPEDARRTRRCCTAGLGPADLRSLPRGLRLLREHRQEVPRGKCCRVVL